MLLNKTEPRTAPRVAPSPLARVVSQQWKTVAISAAVFVIGVLIGYFYKGHKDNPPIAAINGTVIDSNSFAHYSEVAAGQQALKDLTNNELTVQLAKNLDVLPSDSQVKTKYDKAAQQPGFADKLAASGATVDDVKRKLLVGMAQQNVIDKGVNVSNADVQAFYNSNTDPKNPNARYSQPDRVQSAAIITPNKAAHDAALNALATGASFASVAQKYSRDTSAPNGGVLPLIRRGSVNNAKYPGLEKAIFALQAGDQIGSYQSGNSYWIIRCIGREPAFTTPFSQVADECRLGAELAKGLQQNGTSVQNEMRSLEQSSKITYFWPQYKVVSQGQ
jgi:parvulin-like peptidyl-prolyl isomerase